MKVKELIEKLKEMPQDTEVWHLWDGSARTKIEHIWEARGGKVITADRGEVCYYDEYRPKDAPLKKEDPYWRTEY